MKTLNALILYPNPFLSRPRSVQLILWIHLGGWGSRVGFQCIQCFECISRCGVDVMKTLAEGHAPMLEGVKRLQPVSVEFLESLQGMSADFDAEAFGFEEVS